MTTYTHGEVERALLKKGFQQKPGDHRIFIFYYNGQRTKIRTKTSHNSQDISNGLIKKMKDQLHLSKIDFMRLINCPMEKEEYIDKLLQQGLLP